MLMALRISRACVQEDGGDTCGSHGQEEAADHAFRGASSRSVLAHPGEDRRLAQDVHESRKPPAF